MSYPSRRSFHYGIHGNGDCEFHHGDARHFVAGFTVDVTGEATALAVLQPPPGRVTSDRCKAWVQELTDRGFGVMVHPKG